MATSSIKCRVMNCHFNASGACEADAIEVKAQDKDAARSSLGTYCETFVADSNDANLS